MARYPRSEQRFRSACTDKFASPGPVTSSDFWPGYTVTVACPQVANAGHTELKMLIVEGGEQPCESSGLTG